MLDHGDFHQAFYSVPPEFYGRSVWVRWDTHMVRIFDHRFQKIAVHSRTEAGRFSTQPDHIHSEKLNGVERGGTYLLQRAGRIGPESARWSFS